MTHVHLWNVLLGRSKIVCIAYGELNHLGGADQLSFTCAEPRVTTGYMHSAKGRLNVHRMWGAKCITG